MAVLLETSLGDITIDLFIDEVPILAANFLKLCKAKRYNNMLFHSVEKNFIARTGLTTTNTLSKDEGSIFTLLKKKNGKAYQTILNKTCTIPLYGDAKIDKETGLLEEYFHSKLKHNKKGIVSMANDLPNCIGSAFFITLRESIDYLDNKRSIIGVVAEGLDVLDSINASHVEDQIACQPLKPIRIFHTIILDDPFPDPPGLFLNTEFPSPLPIKDDIEDSINKSKTADTEDVLEQELLAFERIARSEAKSRAIALEILGDLPDADLAPPDNVLFVCKLNPITEADDLKLIFSR
jgi:peptidyl-prolyl cis-trans isomerase-like 4